MVLMCVMSNSRYCCRGKLPSIAIDDDLIRLDGNQVEFDLDAKVEAFLLRRLRRRCLGDD